MKILFAIGLVTFATSALVASTHSDERILPENYGSGILNNERYQDVQPTVAETPPPGNTPGGDDPCAELETLRRNASTQNLADDAGENFDRQERILDGRCRQRTAEVAGDRNALNSVLSSNRTEACKALRGTMGEDFNSPPDPVAADALTSNPQVQNRIAECKQLKVMAESQGNAPFEEVNQRESRRQSLDGAIQCSMPASFTIDYNACVSASKLYDGVRVAEKAMDMQQQVRTQNNAKKAQAEAMKKAAEGDMQTGVLDAGISNHDHMKGMMKEKIAAYMIAVGLLSKSLISFPGDKKARQICKSSQSEVPGQTCEQTVNASKSSIVANGSTKMALVTAIAEFTAKGVAAKMAMDRHDNASEAIAKAKQPFEEEPADLMLERCQFNPADPACITPGERVSGGEIERGEFSLGGGGNNAFNLNPEAGEFGEVGAETNLGEGNEIASINNPFADDAKRANDILNPADAAQVQATGGAAGGGGGGVGGGLGGGGASLGSDLAAADKEGDKEPSIKAGKVSGLYGAVGGGGYRGIARSKEKANPFASLFDKKGAAGGAVVDGSIPADIAGKASGLFQKISKRYSRIHADKRIEARNLE